MQTCQSIGILLGILNEQSIRFGQSNSRKFNGAFDFGCVLCMRACVSGIKGTARNLQREGDRQDKCQVEHAYSSDKMILLICVAASTFSLTYVFSFSLTQTL